MVGSVLALSVKPCRACQLSQGESPWQSGIVSGSSAEFVVSPEPLPLGEVDLRSKDGEGEDACLRGLASPGKLQGSSLQKSAPHFRWKCGAL